MKKALSFFLCCMVFKVFAYPTGFTCIDDDRILCKAMYATSDNFVGRPLQGYKKEACIVTEETYQALLGIQNELDAHYPGLHLHIYDGYRPTQAVLDIIQWSSETENILQKLDYYPNINKKDLFELGYVSKKSGHSRGSTVDLTLARFDGEQYLDLDMGTIVDFFGEESNVSYNNLSHEAVQNRRFLQHLMSSHGFRPIQTEWWHFTLINEPYPETYFNFTIE